MNARCTLTSDSRDFHFSLCLRSDVVAVHASMHTCVPLMYLYACVLGAVIVRYFYIVRKEGDGGEVVGTNKWTER